MTFGALAVVFVAIGFAAEGAPPAVQPTLQAIDYAITAVFVAEFVSRFGASYDRRAYLRGHWIDVVALLPFARW
jgi:hypothetical protein